MEILGGGEETFHMYIYIYTNMNMFNFFTHSDEMRICHNMIKNEILSDRNMFTE